MNLVDNAVKFSARGGAVTLRCASQEGSVLAAVEDTGPPIPENERPHLFQRFFRGTSGRAATVPGAGLGLAIAAAEAHLGADLTYEPRRPRRQPLRGPAMESHALGRPLAKPA